MERWPDSVYCSLMREALTLAAQAAEADEVPIGAVVADSEAHIIGRGRERKIEMSDPTAHAEILALREAARSLGDWRLERCVLVATLEPCPMCAGAALLARIPLIVYGAPNAKFGAIETILTLYDEPRWNHQVSVISGVLADQCARVLKDYFASKRG